MQNFFKILFFYLLCAESFALNCDGIFKQKTIVDNEKWSWVYSTDRYSVLGETLLHKEHDSFSLSARENEECLKLNSCSTKDLTCAIIFALTEPFGRKISLGRIQATSYGLYFRTRDIVLKVNNCNKAYLKYYSEVDNFWGKLLPSFGYKVKKVHPREIKLRRPEGLLNYCFDASNNVPVLWSGIDYFPVVTIAREFNKPLGSE